MKNKQQKYKKVKIWLTKDTTGCSSFNEKPNKTSVDNPILPTHIHVGKVLDDFPAVL